MKDNEIQNGKTCRRFFAEACFANRAFFGQNEREFMHTEEVRLP